MCVCVYIAEKKARGLILSNKSILSRKKYLGLCVSQPREAFQVQSITQKRDRERKHIIKEKQISYY